MHIPIILLLQKYPLFPFRTSVSAFVIVWRFQPLAVVLFYFSYNFKTFSSESTPESDENTAESDLNSYAQIYLKINVRKS